MTQDSKFERWLSEAEHATSRSRTIPTILIFTRGWGRNFLFLSNRPALLCCNPEQITELLFLENSCQDSRRRSFWSQWCITGRPLAKHCSFKYIRVLAVYNHFFVVIELTLCSNERNFLLLPPRIDNRHSL